MRVTHVAVLATALLLVGSARLSAEEPTLEEIRQENEDLRREVERLRSRVGELSRRITEDALADTAFLVSTRDGVVRLTPDGVVEAVQTPSGRPLRGRLSRYGDDVYCRNYRTVHRLNKTGTMMASRTLEEGVKGYGFAALPGRRYAVLDNEADRILLVDPTGRKTHDLAMRPEPSSSMQNTYGLVVGNRLLVSEDGDRRILAVDLDTFAVGVFRDLGGLRASIGALAYADGTYYVCTGTAVYAFTEEGPHRLVARIPKGNITGLVIVGRAAFATVNFTGEVLRIDLDSGAVTTVAEGLTRPDGLVVVPR